jgi:hypothetical protein
MRQRQPIRQLPCRLVRRRPVKRHHGGWHAGQSLKLRAPAVADGRYFDVVRAPANSLFECMNDHVVFVREEAFEELSKRRRFYAVVTSDQAKRITKATGTRSLRTVHA